MACYFPGTATLAGIGLVLYALWHKTIMHVLSIVGLVLEITLITVTAAGAVAAVAWTARVIRRRRAAAGACTTCERPCQLALSVTPGHRVTVAQAERSRPGRAPAHADAGPATRLGWPHLPGPAPGTLAGPAARPAPAGPAARPVPADGEPAASLVA
jgi:hypothetical protein